MFQKPFRIKSNSQMKNSERKTLKAEIVQHFKTITDSDLDLIFPNKEIVSTIKAVTHSNQTVIIYLVQKRPMLFSLNNILYPTVYFMWIACDVLPAFTAQSPVLARIVAGADLMLPGVVLPNELQGPSRYGRLAQGDSVLVNLTNNKAAIAVGTAALSSMDMYMSAGRGKCVKILHSFGDKLWKMDGCVPLHFPELGPPNWLVKNENIDDNISENNIEIVKPYSETDSNQDIAEELEQKIQLNATEEMDNLFVYCFLKVIKQSKKNLTVPLLTSQFSKLMMQTCPDGKSLDIKKSSYKKFSKFMKKMTEHDIIHITEQPKGVENITAINITHEAVSKFVLCQNDFYASATSTDNNEKCLNISEACTVTASVLPIFSDAGLRKGDSIKLLDVRKHISNYVKKYQLQDKTDLRFIQPNEELACIVKSDRPQTWEDVMQKISSAMGTCYNISSAGNETKGKGKVEPIILSVGTRSGNKKVTLIDNLELYGIRISDFGKECQHAVAASTSISKPPGKKYDQLLVQGNQILFVGNLLMGKYKVPKRYIRGLELAPKK